MNVRSSDRNLEDPEALICCFESAALIFCLTEICLNKNDRDENRGIGYMKFEAINDQTVSWEL